MATDGGKITVASEEKDPNSMLNYTRRLIELRHATPALGNLADWKVISDLKQPYPMVYERKSGDQICIGFEPQWQGCKSCVAARLYSRGSY